MPRRRLTPEEQIVSRERKRLRKLERRHEKRDAETARVERALAYAEYASIIDADVWGILVNVWNELDEPARSLMRAICREDGHHIARIEGSSMAMCTRCRTYHECR